MIASLVPCADSAMPMSPYERKLCREKRGAYLMKTSANTSRIDLVSLVVDESLASLTHLQGWSKSIPVAGFGGDTNSNTSDQRSWSQPTW